MGSGGIAGAARIGNKLALGYALTFAYSQTGIMPIDCDQAAAMVEHDGIAVTAHPAGIDYYAGSSRMDRRSVIHCDVHAGVVLTGSEDGMHAPAVIGSNGTGAGPYKGTVAAAGRHLGSGFHPLQHGFDIIGDGQHTVIFLVGFTLFLFGFIQFLGPLFPHLFRIAAFLHQGGLVFFDLRHLGVQQILPLLNLCRFFFHDGNQL